MKNVKTMFLGVLLGGLAITACDKKVENTAASTEANKIENKTNNSESVNKDEMPPKVKAFFQDHYANIAVAKYEFKSKTNGNKYEVKLDNGVEAEFDNEENWTEIKDYNGVPNLLVPENILNYVNVNYKDIKIKSIEKKKDKNKIDVDLLNGVELQFDSNGTFLKLD